jgi:aminopeptidase YwaD
MSATFGLAEHILEECGPRLAGSSSVRKAAQLLRQAMGPWADQTEAQLFQIRPQAFLGWSKIVAVFYTLGVGLAWVGFLTGASTLGWALAALCGVISLGAVLGEVIFYREVLEPFYQPTVAENVLGTLEPSEEVKAQIIICGHHDSAREFTFLKRWPALYPIRIAVAFIGLVSFTLLAFIYVIGYQFLREIPFEQTALLIFTALLLFLLPLWSFAAQHGTPGAGDNLISSTLAVALGTLFSERRKDGIGLKHTRLIVASWDAEECGLRGARAYVRQNREVLTGTPTTVINLECLYRTDELAFLTSDMNGLIPLSRNLAKEGTAVAKSLGIRVGATPIPFLGGATDAAEFARMKCRATTLLGMDLLSAPRRGIYHTHNDTLDKIEPLAVQAIISILINLIEHEDRILIHELTPL